MGDMVMRTLNKEYIEEVQRLADLHNKKLSIINHLDRGYFVSSKGLLHQIAGEYRITEEIIPSADRHLYNLCDGRYRRK